MELLTGSNDVVSVTARTARLLGALPIAAFIVGADDNILASNPAADALLQLPAGAAGTLRLAVVPAEISIPLASGLAELRQPGHVDAVRRMITRRDGYPVTLTLVLIGGRAGGDGNVMVTAPGAPGSSALVEGGAEAPVGQVKDFLAMLAHELRNPLTPILHAVHVLRHRVKGDRIAVQAAEVADRQARHEARLLDDLLEVSRVLLGKITLHTADVDLGDVLKGAVEASELAFRARAHRFHLTGPDAPLPIHGDPDRLEQVFKNVLGNAAKYSYPGNSVWITAASAHGMATVCVRDEGMGMEPDVLPHIFDLFYQADTSLARSQGGLGVGLTLAHHLVELHKGTLLVRSQGRGHGSEFEIGLPLRAPAAAPDPAVPEGAGPPPQSQHVLLIEDSPDSRVMLRMLLELNGHVVDDARDGRSGIAAASANAPDVVLIDIGLPDVSGYDVARTLRRHLGPLVRLVALTGYGDAAARRLAVEAGFDRHLVKPVAPEQLMLALQSR